MTGRMYTDEQEDPGRVIYEALSGAWRVSGRVGARGGRLIIDEAGDGRHDYTKVSLTIPGRALLSPVPIGMSVGINGMVSETETGFVFCDPGKLSKLHVSFGPDGQVFEKDASLVVQVGKDRVDVDVRSGQLKMEHTSSGETFYTGVKVKKSMSGTVTLIIKVPGFSVYSLGGGR